MSMSSRLYERSQQVKHFFRQRWATWRALAAREGTSSRVRPADDDRPALLDSLEPRLLMTGSIAGKVFADPDGDGTKVIGESALAGWTVFLDANQNGTLDSGELWDDTDADGKYEIPSLATGNHRVTVLRDTGWLGTAPSTGVTTVTLATDQNATGINFGFKYERVIDDSQTGYETSGT